MVSYSDLMERLPSQSVIEAVERTSKSDDQRQQQQQQRRLVAASDVATAAGVSLSQARRDLTALASLSRGDVAVSSDGELLYAFPDNLRSVLAQNSAKYKAEQAIRKAWPAVFWFVRVSFGVALLASIAAIFSTIFFLQTASSSDSSDDRRDNRRSSSPFGGGGGMYSYNPWFGPSPFDVFYYRPYGYYGVYGRDNSGNRRTNNGEPPEMGFLESVFSYIFGDGDPNNRLEEQRLKLASQLIRENGGAVTAEQLAPFCDDAPDPTTTSSGGDEGEEGSAYVDERFVLPIVTALNGEPEVTDDGDIVYVFPELQVSAASSPSFWKSPLAAAREGTVLRRAGLSPKASASEIKRLLDYNRVSTRGALERKDLIAALERALPDLSDDEEAEALQADPSLLQEREWKFSVAPDLNKFLAGGLGVVNLGGALYLGNLLNQYALYGVKLPAFYGAVQAGYPLLLGYAVLFNAIPAVRNFWIQRENDKIRQRNATRRKWRTVLGSVGQNARTSLGRKVQSATRWRKKVRQLGASGDEIVYDTSKPIEEVELKKEEEALSEFDKLLGMDDSNNGGGGGSFQ